MNSGVIFKIFNNQAAWKLTNQNGHQVKTGTAMQGHSSQIQAMCESRTHTFTKRIKSQKKMYARIPKPNNILFRDRHVCGKTIKSD